MLGNQVALIDFTHSSCKYISGLYKLYLEYQWPQVLKCHFKFHNCQVVEMHEGSYASWGHVDLDLMTIYLFGHPKLRPSKLACNNCGPLQRTCQSKISMHLL